MIPVFNKRRKHMLAMKAMREGQIPAASPVEVTCPKCQTATARQQLSRNQYVCPNCGHHFPIGAYFRLSLILDSGSFRELDENLTSADPMEFPGYSEKLDQCRQKTGLSEAVVTATGRIEGRKVAVAVLDSRFLMGSMSAAVGEKVTRLIEHATRNRLPVVIFSASGGARMDSFCQLENGVGMWRMLHDEFMEALEETRAPLLPKKIDLATGELAYPLICKLANAMQKKMRNVKIEVHEIKNEFFGGNVTVAGLITGTDLKKQLKGKLSSRTLGIPEVMLREERDKFLDDVTVKELERELGVRVRIMPQRGDDLVQALLK